MLKSKLFWLGFLIRFSLLFVFSNYFISQFFVPFLDKALENLSANPWSLSPPEFFPYGVVPYIFLVLPRMLLHFIDAAHIPSALGAVDLFSFKVPLLMFDILFLKVLTSWPNISRNRILTLFWLNPALIYITYVHGQLDIISMSLAFLSLYILVVRQKNTWSAIVLGLAVGSKFHVIILLPLILAYFWNRNFRQQAVQKMFMYGALCLGVGGLCMLPPALASQLSNATLGAGESLRLMGWQIILSSDRVLFFGVMLTLFAFGRVVASTRISDWGLVWGSGLTLGSIVLATATAPGWYFWIFPFLILLFACYQNLPILLFWLFSFSATLFFVVFDIDKLRLLEIGIMKTSVLFTLTQTLLAACLLFLYRIALSKEAPFIGWLRPYRIGIAGDSGSGKDWFTQKLIGIFGEQDTQVIHGDNYHRWERGDSNWKTMTHLNPEANELHSMSEHLLKVSQGQEVEHRHYNHNSGRFETGYKVGSTKTLISQGLHTFYLKSSRNNFDLKIFMDPHSTLREEWKINRDSAERGKSRQEVLDQLRSRQVDSKAYIEIQKNFADLILSFQQTNTLQITANSHWDFKELVQAFKLNHLDCELLIDSLTPDKVLLLIRGNATQAVIEQIAREKFSSLRQLTRGRNPPVWSQGLEGLMQLVVVWTLYQKQRTEEA